MSFNSKRGTVSRKLITPKSWGQKSMDNFGKSGNERSCAHCGKHGLILERTIAGEMFRCPACKKLQF